jgi:hypothetical protein
MAMYFLSDAPNIGQPAGRSSRIGLRALQFAAQRLTMWSSERRSQANTVMHLAVSQVRVRSFSDALWF